MLKTIVDNKKQKIKKNIYRLTHPKETIKENINYTKKIIFGNFDSYTPSTQSVLNKYGNEQIINIVLHRNPLSKVITSLLSTWTWGETDRRLQQQPKDTLFHIGMWITLKTGKIIKIEKNEVINIQENPIKPKEEQTSQNVSKPNNLNLFTMLEKTRRQFGNNRYFSYSAKRNNCGDFIEMILQANNLNSQATHDFIGQDTKTILNGFPNMRKLMNTVTDIGGRFTNLIEEDNNLPTKLKYEEPIVENIEEIIQGEGLRKNNKWISFVKQIQKEKNLNYKQALIISKPLYKKLNK